MVPRENVRGGMGDTTIYQAGRQPKKLSQAAALNNLVKRREEEQEV